MNRGKRFPSMGWRGCADRALYHGCTRHRGADRADAGVRRSGAVGDRKSYQRQGETDLLTLIAHLCYNKDTDEAHKIAVHGLYLIVGVREPKLCSRPRTTDYNTNVRFVNIFFQKKGRKEAVLYHLARSAPRSAKARPSERSAVTAADNLRGKQQTSAAQQAAAEVRRARNGAKLLFCTPTGGV